MERMWKCSKIQLKPLDAAPKKVVTETLSNKLNILARPLKLTRI